MRWLVTVAVLVILSLCLAPLGGAHAISGHGQHVSTASCGACLAPVPTVGMVFLLVLLGAWTVRALLSVPQAPTRSCFHPPRQP